MSSIYVIASYGGPRRNNQFSGADLLLAQHYSLNKYHNSIDKVLVVSTGGGGAEYKPGPPEYEEMLDTFDHLTCDNEVGSYGAWLKAWDTFGDQYDWYYLLEDDYVWMVDDWDQRLRDMWTPETGYLCGLVGANEYFQYHVSHSGGLVSSAAFKAANLSLFRSEHGGIYNPQTQIKWGESFIDSPLKVRSIADKYDVPFYTGNSILRLINTPAIFGPVQYDHYPHHWRNQ